MSWSLPRSRSTVAISYGCMGRSTRTESTARASRLLTFRRCAIGSPLLVCEYTQTSKGDPMAQRRKVSNLLALAVLSVLVERPMHPYEMATVLRDRGKDQDMKIKWGSLYTVVQNLEKHGLIEAGDSERRGGRPERTLYRITPAGRDELEDWVRELVSTPETEYPRFEAGLSLSLIHISEPTRRTPIS